MADTRSRMIFFVSKLLLPGIFFLLSLIMFPVNSFSQQDTTAGGTPPPVRALSKLVKYSKASFKNDLNYPGKVYGCLGGNNTFLVDFEAQETFSVEIGNYDSLLFFSEWDLNDRKKYVINYYMA